MDFIKIHPEFFETHPEEKKKCKPNGRKYVQYLYKTKNLQPHIKNSLTQ